MPEQGPGLRKNDAVATKAVLHGDPCIENGVPGVAFKNAQLGTFVDPSVAGARTVAVNEKFTIQIGGKIFVRTALLNGGLGAFPEGTKCYIKTADNTIDPAATGAVKFGVVQKVDTARGGVYINTNLRDTF